MDDVAEYIRNVDKEQFANIRDEIFEMLDEIEIDFEQIMNEDSFDEEVLSDDTGCASDMNEYEIVNRKIRVVSEIHTLNARTKHCVIHSYYTDDSLTMYIIHESYS